MRFKHREFWGFHDTRLDETQAEIILISLLLGLNNKANNLFNLLNKAHQYASVDDVESCMEGRQSKTQFRCIGCKSRVVGLELIIIVHQSAHRMHKGMEDNEHPKHTKEVEEHVGKSRSSCLRVGRERSQYRGNSGANILTHHQSYALIDGQNARRTKNHRDGHDGSRAVNEHR